MRHWSVPLREASFSPSFSSPLVSALLRWQKRARRTHKGRRSVSDDNKLMFNLQMTKVHVFIVLSSLDIRRVCESYFRFFKTALLLMPVKRECSFRKS